MGTRIGLIEEHDDDLAWKFAKLLAGGSVLAALLWWNPIPFDVLLQVVFVLVLPMLLTAAFIGIVGYDTVGTTWNSLASGKFAARVEKHLKDLRAG